MTRLVLGVLLWSVVHFIPAIASDLKKNIVSRFGDYPYKGVFALIMFLAIYLIISGWKAAAPEVIYIPPDWGGYAAAVLVLIGFVLFLAPYPPNNLKRLLRHPQLMGMIFWGVGHLLANGDTRSVVFFGGLAAWALVEMLLLNRRDGVWTKPVAVPGKRDFALVLFSALVYLTFLYTHAMLFGGTELI